MSIHLWYTTTTTLTIISDQIVKLQIMNKLGGRQWLATRIWRIDEPISNSTSSLYMCKIADYWSYSLGGNQFRRRKLSEFKPDRPILIHAARDLLWIQIPTESPTIDLLVRMNTTSTTVGQHSLGLFDRAGSKDWVNATTGTGRNKLEKLNCKLVAH